MSRRLPTNLALALALLAAAAVLGWTAWTLRPPPVPEELNPSGVARPGWVEVTFPTATVPGPQGRYAALEVRQGDVVLFRTAPAILADARWEAGPVLMGSADAPLTVTMLAAGPDREVQPGLGREMARWTVDPSMLEGESGLARVGRECVLQVAWCTPRPAPGSRGCAGSRTW